jgi:hypothetical protein
MTSLKLKRQYVNNYLEKLESIDPLEFVRFGGMKKKDNPMPIEERNTLEETIYEILNMAQSYCSYNSVTGELETTPGRLRSCIDIWRHLKTVKPDIDIFTIMETIYAIRHRLYGHYCSTVHRTVFKPSGDATFAWHGDVVEGRILYCEEFGSIKFSEWKKMKRATRKVVKSASENK